MLLFSSGFLFSNDIFCAGSGTPMSDLHTTGGSSFATPHPHGAAGQSMSSGNSSLLNSALDVVEVNPTGDNCPRYSSPQPFMAGPPTPAPAVMDHMVNFTPPQLRYQKRGGNRVRDERREQKQRDSWSRGGRSGASNHGGTGGGHRVRDWSVRGSSPSTKRSRWEDTSSDPSSASSHSTSGGSAQWVCTLPQDEHINPRVRYTGFITVL